ncbi:hypothetical protein TRN7648_03571 [Tropicibacter naphthalenivorans]|uniref:Uncharacterized protein n=1 Tax=Tropicibacter naphthalenivorans TaxID=441103 RepID=A0A0P1GIP4_9RHOB|nr:hypothetical protein TRN7648_03571 [Tropicibacter naphthalenivorans]
MMAKPDMTPQQKMEWQIRMLDRLYDAATRAPAKSEDK